ncbi:hypothetical protein TUM12370_21770 [Salmonella enterica subsp. enterica serovar Choleraesuis]|nr:hypothetical protein TUM12370_21770 [Salmonella enterica subsp. enterica serovar Choleraesuis]
MLTNTIMMTNIFENHSAEALALLTPALLTYAVFLGILPAVLMLKKRIRPQSRWQTLLMHSVAFIASAMIIICITVVFYKDYASLLRNNKELIKLVTPDSYTDVFHHYSRSHNKVSDPRLVMPKEKEDGARTLIADACKTSNQQSADVKVQPLAPMHRAPTRDEDESATAQPAPCFKDA